MTPREPSSHTRNPLSTTLTVHLKPYWERPAVRIFEGEGETRSSIEPAGHPFPTRLHSEKVLASCFERRKT